MAVAAPLELVRCNGDIPIMDDLEGSLCNLVDVDPSRIGYSLLPVGGWVYIAVTGRMPELALLWLEGTVVGYCGN